jgi:hypothetical protein
VVSQTEIEFVHKIELNIFRTTSASSGEQKCLSNLYNFCIYKFISVCDTLLRYFNMFHLAPSSLQFTKEVYLSKVPPRVNPGPHRVESVSL